MRRYAWIALFSLATACRSGGADPAEAPGATPESPAASAASPAQEAAPEAPGAEVAASESGRGCDAFAQGLCEVADVPCETARALLTAAEVTDADCDEGLALFGVIEDEEPALRMAMANQALIMVLRNSPKLTPEQLEAITGHARAAAMAERSPESPADLEALYADLPCPGVSTRVGKKPPHGDQVWCATADGTRHGPASKWHEGKLVRTSEYSHGKLVSVSYMPDRTKRFPGALFICPDTSTRHDIERDGTRELQCVDAEGEMTHVLHFEGDRLTHSLEADGLGNRFVGISAP